VAVGHLEAAGNAKGAVELDEEARPSPLHLFDQQLLELQVQLQPHRADRLLPSTVLGRIPAVLLVEDWPWPGAD
jgi:hypothetical protein